MVKAKDSTEKSWWFMELLSRFFRITGFFLLILGLTFSLAISKGYAQEDPDPVKLSGTDSGLLVSPSDPYLFDLNNMNPGDFVDRTLVIENNYSRPFTLYLTAQKVVPEEGEKDLSEQLNLRVTLRGTEIYNGRMDDFATSAVYLGVFNPGVREKLVATVNLPGPETGNEYQGATATVLWTFTAQSSGEEPPEYPPGEEEVPEEEIPEEEVPLVPPEEVPEEEVPEVPPEVVEIPEEEVPKQEPKPLPKTGEISHWLFYGAGGAMVFCGLVLGLKKKQ
ncbi:MAG TPA: LPXTG cell wall anchor domain-containing protein [Bacillota bacterium]|nr:LPXTG cell wall anchor domain-containing protein [Bacillota bacterium]